VTRAELRALVRCADRLGDEGALAVLSLRLAESAGWLPSGSCARWSALASAWRGDPAIESLRARSGGRLPAGPLPLESDLPRPGVASVDGERTYAAESLQTLLAMAGPPESLPIAYELLTARARGRTARRSAGLFYTPPEIAAQVVALALAHGPVLPAAPRLLDPCAGAGSFLLAAARALEGRSRAPALGEAARPPALLCAGSDLDRAALQIAGAALALLAGPHTSAEALSALPLAPLDSLEQTPPHAPADLLIANPPYGHLASARQRARLARDYPALRGAEIDLYSAFILRSLSLVRPGGCAALLVPDTWMTNARSAPLRAAVLDAAELRAVADLGKPFAAAKDTRVQAIVLVRRETSSAHSPAPAARPTFTARLEATQLLPLAPLEESNLRARISSGWQPYRSRGELALCAAMERHSIPLGQLCRVGYGLRTGNNARHIARGPLPAGEIALCGGEDIAPFELLNGKPKWLRGSTPELDKLVAKQRGAARVAVQRIRTNAATPWSRWLEAALIPAEIICLDSLSTLSPPDSLSAEERDELLWALLALCGSVALNRYHRLQTTDVNVKPSALRELPAPVKLREREPMASLARWSKLRAQARGSESAHRLERQIDREVYSLYSLAPAEIQCAEDGFWGERAAQERAYLVD